MAETFDNQSPYLYAYNNPVRFTDYMGMNAEDEVKPDDPEPEEVEGSDMDGYGDEAPEDYTPESIYSSPQAEKTDEEWAEMDQKAEDQMELEGNEAKIAKLETEKQAEEQELEYIDADKELVENMQNDAMRNIEQGETASAKSGQHIFSGVINAKKRAQSNKRLGVINRAIDSLKTVNSKIHERLKDD